jgi:nanoRNase/pAp phosphatase (c-di-AMP/oligoRNAs hydrolase)
MNIINDLVSVYGEEEFLYIQTHNYPDHDAVASAAGLRHLLGTFGVETRIIYEGDIQRDSLRKMIELLEIPVTRSSECALEASKKIIIVDGCKGNKNVTDLVGEEVAVIDHHRVKATDDVPFVDIRPDHGACSSIIYSYYRELGVEVPRSIATALMIGINMDTALLTRGVGEADVQAYADLYPLADIRLQNTLLRNYIQTKDLDFYRYAINNVKIDRGVCFCYFPGGCNQNLLGILGDFFLSLEEIDFVILCAKNNGNINFSVRNEREEWNASLVIQNALRGVGFGGGHMDMAGGIISNPASFDAGETYAKFARELGLA